MPFRKKKLTFEEAEKKFHKKYPKRIIMSAADLDEERYIVWAQEDPTKPDYADPIFTIDKYSGRVIQTSGIDMLDRIEEAYKCRKIK